MALNTLDSIVAGMLPAPFPFAKAAQTAEGAGTWHSLWRAAGLPGAGANPPAFSAGSGYVPNRQTAGAWPYPLPGAGETRVAKASAMATAAGTLIIYDRLWACSGFGTVVTTAQSITTPGDVGRVNVFDGVELWGEVYSAPGATGATWTVSYTDQDNNAGRSATYTHPANAESVGQMFPFMLQGSDRGVRSVQTFTASVSSGTAGDIGLTLMRRLVEIPLPSVNVGAVLDVLACGFPRVLDGACLALMVQCTGASTGIIMGSVNLSQG